MKLNHVNWKPRMSALILPTNHTPVVTMATVTPMCMSYVLEEILIIMAGPLDNSVVKIVTHFPNCCKLQKLTLSGSKEAPPATSSFTLSSCPLLAARRSLSASETPGT